MPGVPRELDRMMDEQVMPLIEKQWPNRPVTCERRLRTFGIGESALEDALNKVDVLTRIEQDSQLRFGYRTSFPDNFLRIIAQASSAEQAEEKLDEVSAWIREAIGPKVYGEGEITLEEVLSGQLRAQGQTLALAESCTGGLVAQLLTNLPGSSEIFKGGIVAYANAAKTDLLGVSSEILAGQGAVSEPVAAAMAQGARKRFGTTFGLASTGISGPDGGTPQKPVGTVYLAWAWEGETRVEHFQLEFKRDMHRRLCAQILFDGLRRHLMGLDVVSSNFTGRKFKATENR
jgi:nicotinamide-nucleotide amidase